MSTEPNTPPTDTPPADDTPPTPPAGDTPPADPPHPGDVDNGIFSGLKPSGTPDPTPDGRPDHVPEKFWDAEKKEIRVEALAKSYVELEKVRARQVKIPEKYEIDGIDEPTQAELKKQGFSQEQAKWYLEQQQQAVETARQQAANASAQLEFERLQRAWKIDPADQVATKQRLQSVFDYAVELFGDERLAKVMTTTAQQVLALESQMKVKMAEGLPFAGHPESPKPVTRARLDSIVRDPNYDNDPELQAEAARIADILNAQKKKLRGA